MEHTLNAVAIIQARLGSTRLPGKVLADICGKPLLQRLIQRVSATQGISRVVVATTTDLADDELAGWCVAHDVPVYRGSVNDVLDRFWQCAQQHPAEFIVRVTADDPLKDPQIIAQALALCASASEVDYASNTLHPTYPEGLDIEVVRFRTLERAACEAKLPSEREHVMPYVWKHPDRFVLRNFSMQPDLSHWRWTVDKPADLELMRRIFTHFADQPLVSYQAVIAWLKENPELLAINAGTIRNEGYFATLITEQKNDT
jgi:spore coat polysaccharide biosynthesis protein SpsF